MLSLEGGGPMRRRVLSAALVFVAWLLLPAVARAQGQASISGMVKDASGAILPGVTVEASSPALIEKARTAVTDGAGRDRMVDGCEAGRQPGGRGTGQLGVGSVTQTQEAAIEELVYDTGAQGAEYAASGVRMNLIPKEGGNRFLAEGVAYASNSHFEW